MSVWVRARVRECTRTIKTAIRLLPSDFNTNVNAIMCTDTGCHNFCLFITHLE